MPKTSVAGKEIGRYGSPRQSIWSRKRDLCYLIVRVDSESMDIFLKTDADR